MHTNWLIEVCATVHARLTDYMAVGEGTGQPLSRDRNIPGADAVEIAEGNMAEHANASARATRRGQRDAGQPPF